MNKEYIKSNFCIPIIFGIGITFLFTSCEQEIAPPLSPSQALETFHLADPELEIELVASEPLVQDPVAISFDESGRLWVVEMLGFMKDIDGTGETDQVGRVSVLFDDNGDGQMDRSIVFLDSLVLPRAIAIVNGGILVAENIPLWFVEDTNGDFVADRKTLIDAEYGGLGLPEHSANGLLRGIDNWYYNAKSKWRYRKSGDSWIKEETEARGQWGITQDNWGRLFYNYNWSQLHGDLVPPNVLNRNKNHIPFSGIDHGLTLERRIYPIRPSPAVNRGYIPGTFDEEGKLLEFTSACGPLVHRGNGLPPNYLGAIFVCEPTSNLIRQNKVTEDGFLLGAENAYPDREFLASTDERFRPISLAPGPDGALYVVDMYKGIIQHAPYMTPYLREVILERKLESPIHMGRIWRIKSKNSTAQKTTDLSKLGSSELVPFLGHSNGWTRDMAQRLLVEQNNPVCIPELIKMAASDNPLGQIHALWTLNGLGYTAPHPYLEALNSNDPKVAQVALRLVMTLLSEHPNIRKDLSDFIRYNFENASPILQMQMILSLNEISPDLAFLCIKKFLEDYGDFPVSRDVVMSSLEGRENELLRYLLTQNEWQNYSQNKEIFLELLASAITNSTSISEIKDLLVKIESNDPIIPSWIKLALINGMVSSKVANDGLEIALDYQPKLFLNSNTSDENLKPLLNKLEYLFTWVGKPKRPLEEAIAKQDIDPTIFAAGRQQYINLCASCHGTQGEGLARFAPPLKHSEWVTGEPYKLGMILLHGIEGPIMVNGKMYDIPDILPNMPSFSTLQDKDIAAISTYIRNSWGNTASPIPSKVISGVRVRNQGKVTPWYASELDTLIFDATQ